jgi:hypothetical protein
LLLSSISTFDAVLYLLTHQKIGSINFCGTQRERRIFLSELKLQDEPIFTGNHSRVAHDMRKNYQTDKFSKIIDIIRKYVYNNRLYKIC